VLLDARADPDALAANENGLHPINSAAAAVSDEIVALLLERGASVDAAQKGADMGARIETGSTAAELADRRGHAEVARRLGAAGE
jgi:ankyrin repeat protein